MFMSPQNTLSFPASSSYGLGYAGQENTPTPESGYYSSPPQSYDNNHYNQPYTQQPILFSPDQKPLVQQQYTPQQPMSSPEGNRVTASSADGRKIAGTVRAQRSSMTGALNGALGGGLTAMSGGPGSTASGFSSRSAPSAPTGMQPPPNPYSNFNAKQPHISTQGSHIPVPTGHPQMPSTSASAPKYNTPTTAKPVQHPAANSPQAYNPKKRIRHSTAQSLSVPKQIFGHHHQEQDQQPSILQSIMGGPAVGQLPMRFDSMMNSTTDTFDGSSDSSSSDEDDVPPQSATKGKGAAGRKQSKKGSGKDLARL